MRKILFFSSIVLFISFVFSGCGLNKEVREYAKEVFEKPHELRKMTEIFSTEGNLHGSFFLLGGSINGNLISETKITFSWLHPKGNYFTTTLPYDCFELKLDSSCEIPKVSFVWAVSCGCNGVSMSSLNDLTSVNKLIKSVILTCHPDQWKMDITLPFEEKPIN